MKLPKYDEHCVVFNDSDHILDVKNDNQSESMVDTTVDIKHYEATGQRFYKSLYNSMPKKPCCSWKRKQVSEENAGNDLNFPVSSTKDEVGSNTAIDIPITHFQSGKTNRSFRVGDRIQMVAHKLNLLNPILKHNDRLTQKAVPRPDEGGSVLRRLEKEKRPQPQLKHLTLDLLRTIMELIG